MVTASAVPTRDVSSLNHEIFDDAMKFASFIAVSFLKRLCQLNIRVDNNPYCKMNPSVYLDMAK